MRTSLMAEHWCFIKVGEEDHRQQEDEDEEEDSDDICVFFDI